MTTGVVVEDHRRKEFKSWSEIDKELNVLIPGIDGWEVCEIVRLNPNYRNIKIIFLTAQGREVEIAKGLALGADAYITKAFSNGTRVANVTALLEKTIKKPGNKPQSIC